MPALSTSRYVEIGTYIGQFFLPGGGTLPNIARVVCLVGKGDRLFKVKNLAIRHSFITSEQLTFSSGSPFVATLDHPADGNQSNAVSLFTAGGVGISTNKWQFLFNTMTQTYDRIQIVDSAFDPLAIYYTSYQSTDPDIKDSIPNVTIQQLSVSAQIRQILSIGTIQDHDDYSEYSDYLDNAEVTAPVAQPGNVNLSTGFSVVTAGLSNTGTGSLAVSPSASYTHQYNRLYSFAVTAASGVTPTRVATLTWTATPGSPGNHALPATPINPALTLPSLTLSEATPTTLTNQLLELGVVVDFAFGATNFTVGDTFAVEAMGPGLIELDPLLTNTNQFTTYSAISTLLGVGSTGSALITSLPDAYTLTDHNLSFRLVCAAASGAFGSRVASFVWSGYGTRFLNGSFTISETVSGSTVQVLGASGVTLTLAFGASNFVVDDLLSFVVLAPQIHYKGKESVRNITLSIGTVVYPGANQALVNGGYVTDTPEGRFGTWGADTAINFGRFSTTDGLQFYVRNTYQASGLGLGNGGSRLVVSDQFKNQALSLGTIDFSLQRETTEVFANPSGISTDVTGAITGTPGARYMILANMPLSILTVHRISDQTAVPYTQVPNTPFLLITDPLFRISDGDVQVIYRWAGLEPLPGQVYYVTGYFLRPNAMYNRPFLFLTEPDSAALLAPSTVKNDLLIGSKICWDYALPGLFVIQVQDSDQDGIYNRADFQPAITAFLQDKRATDLVVLNNFTSLPDQLQIINRANDPFELHDSMTFVGAPIGTPIGSEQEIGSLVAYARRTLAVYGQSPAHGTRTMVGSTRATRTIVLDDLSTTSVTLDGSFIAAALAGLVSSFKDPKATVLLGQLTSFDTMQTYTPQENALLGAAGIIFFADLGSGVFEIREDLTTDPFSPDTYNLNQMTQKQFVTRDIRIFMNQIIIGLVFPSANSGIALLKAELVSRLNFHVTNSNIGDYQDDAGNVRELDPATDASVFRDPADPTLFHIGYNYFLATVAKRIFGLYTVNLPGGFPS